MVTALASLGVVVSLDDVVPDLPTLLDIDGLGFGQIKIDAGSASLLADSGAVAAVSHLVDYCRQHEVVVVAEGVSDASAWERAVGLGAGLVQGWQVARPMPVDELPSWFDSVGGVVRPPQLAVPQARLRRANGGRGRRSADLVGAPDQARGTIEG